MEDEINTKGDQVKNLVLKKWRLRSVIVWGGGGRLGLIELFLPHIQLMTLCCRCRWEWLCFPGYCLGIPVKMH